MYRFYHFAAGYIEAECERDPTLWSAFLDLYKKLYTIEQKDRHKQTHLKRLKIKDMKTDLLDEDLNQFLQEEMALDLDLHE